MKKIAILQSNYIPWKGYFDLINTVDDFVLLDEVQYTKQDWRNRNRIKTKNGLLWLTIPIRQESFKQRICETKISDWRWRIKHWKAIKQNYAKTKYFASYKDKIELLYTGSTQEFLSEVNFRFIKGINEILGIQTKLHYSIDFKLLEDQNKRLINICKELGANIYLSGPAAKGYLNEKLFESEGVSVCWMDYSGYPEYDQLFPPFEHSVTILDLLFNTGSEAYKYMKSFGFNSSENP